MKTKTHILSVSPNFFLIVECMMAGKRCLLSNEKKKDEKSKCVYALKKNNLFHQDGIYPDQCWQSITI